MSGALTVEQFEQYQKILMRLGEYYEWHEAIQFMHTPQQQLQHIGLELGTPYECIVSGDYSSVDAILNRLP